MIRPEILLPLWENLINPDRVKPSLVRIGLYLCIQEMLVEMLIAFPRSLTLDSHPGKFVPEGDFRLSVVPILQSRRNEALKQSWSWWLQKGALSDEDRVSFESAAAYRHESAHETIVKLLLNDEELWQHYFKKMITLATKIDDWWRANESAPVQSEAITPGRQLQEHLLQNRLVFVMLVEAALGDGVWSHELLEECRRQGWILPNKGTSA